jgi:hypothetical protein
MTPLICNAPKVELRAAAVANKNLFRLCVGLRKYTREDERAQPNKKYEIMDLSTAKQHLHVCSPCAQRQCAVADAANNAVPAVPTSNGGTRRNPAWDVAVEYQRRLVRTYM